jgi:hypothetical protein
MGYEPVVYKKFDLNDPSYKKLKRLYEKLLEINDILGAEEFIRTMPVSLGKKLDIWQRDPHITLLRKKSNSSSNKHLKKVNINVDVI